MRIHSTRTQIQKVILYSKTSIKRSFKRFLVYTNKSNTDFQPLIKINCFRQTKCETKIFLFYKKNTQNYRTIHTILAMNSLFIKTINFHLLLSFAFKSENYMIALEKSSILL